ncbi:aspartate kinase [Tuberibacillus sp. Marseille-P3662]|uniref:aspartate kinase n=1 Tax=Tuberibacillus sp. Marseille-P3662 TaxID=1965358 RepID=UPI000A1C9E2A|nr:aspartate kinase [Tuberibacillus sp. Marseille-P3662]
MSTTVMKFGGTSVGSVDKIRHVAQRIVQLIEAGDRVVTVVSAMGKTTDNLVEMADQITQQPDKREMDMLLSTGEQQTIALLSMCLRDMGYSAISLTGWQAGITTEAMHGNARIEDIRADAIEHHLDEGKVVIVAGFQGMTSDGQITTLGRGGSDTTAVAVAAAIQADRCDICTDVPGVFTTDPRYVDQATKLDEITYDEMLELANLGAGVLHPRSVENAKTFQVPLMVRSSFSEEEGTMIKERIMMEKAPSVRGLAFQKDVTKLTIIGLPAGYTALSEVFTTLANQGIDVDIIIQNAGDEAKGALSFTINTEELEIAFAALENKVDAIQYQKIDVESGLVKVSIVGSGMVSNPGVAAQMFSALSENQVPVKMVSTSDIKISTVVDAQYLQESLNILHETFQLSENTAEAVIK